MSKLVGLTAVEWLYRCKYMAALEKSGRTRLEGWEIELNNWNPDDETTLPSNDALANLRDCIRSLN